MRIDARNLLDRLGRTDFSYKEFEDRFTDLELWPLMEALLRDHRLQALDPAAPAVGGAKAGDPGASGPNGTAPEVDHDKAPAASGSAAEPLKSVFGRYEQGAPPPAPASAAPAPDVRGLLRRLSDADAEGNV